MYENKLFFKTSLDDEIFYLTETILINFKVKRNGISTSKLNGGYSNNYKHVFNHHLSQENIDYLENHDVEEYLIQQCRQLNVDSAQTTGLITLAQMNNVAISVKTFKNLEITAITTAGVRTNASRAGDPASYYEENGKFGTINTILLLNCHLNHETLLDALMTATEAKTVALNNLKIPSQYSNGFATGTGTDGMCIFSNLESDNTLTNAGKHSKLGELIAKAVIESQTKAIAKQVWINKSTQSNVLVRLNRYSLDINKFYDTLNYNKQDFIKQLKNDAEIPENVAITSSILNLFDEAENDLIKKEDAYKLASQLKEKCNSYPVKALLEYWIEYFIHEN